MKFKSLVLLLIWGICLFLNLTFVMSLKTKPKGSKGVTTRPNAYKISSSTTEKLITNSTAKSPKDSLNLTSRILQIINPDLANEFTVIPKPENSDLIMGKDLIKDAKIILECSAPFPVQWIYSGDGIPEISTNTSLVKSTTNSQNNRNSNHFTATAALGFNQNLKESDTGMYICKSVQNPEDSIFYYIYVPGKSLFTSKKGHDVIVPASLSFVRIPCSVSSPDVTVALQKKVEGFLQCPVETLMKFAPKTGFALSYSGEEEFYDLSGDYICIASLNETHQTVEYSVKQLSSVGNDIFLSQDFNKDIDEDDNAESEGILGRNDGSCFPNPCGPDSICRMAPGVSRLPICKCKRGYDGSPPQCTLSTPCIPNPCGPNSQCSEIPGKNSARCSCLLAYIGRPPHCQPECLLNLDCPVSMACINQQCEDPCEDYCGNEAICQVREHIPTCSCPPGQKGDPRKNGKCIRTRGPSVNYFPSRPGYPENSVGTLGTTDEPDSFKTKFACEPWPCGPYSECRPVGENAHCSCSRGYVGVPPNCQRPDCRSNMDCSRNKVCIDYICSNPCDFTKCGQRAKCMVVNLQPKCVCPNGFRGDPLIRCRSYVQGSQSQNNQGQGEQNSKPPISSYPESPSSSEEYPLFPSQVKPPGSGVYPGSNGINNNNNPPSGIAFPSPPNHSTENSPCKRSPCGKNSICSFRNQTIGCKCPVGMIGFGSDPYVECFASQNPCEMCGPLSKCDVMKNRQPVCSCLPGKIGSPPYCRENNCERNSDCEDHEGCKNGLCVDPCVRSNCGKNAVCRPMRHLPVCACQKAPDRDPLYGCPPLRKYEMYDSKYYGSFEIQ